MRWISVQDWLFRPKSRATSRPSARSAQLRLAAPQIKRRSQSTLFTASPFSLRLCESYGRACVVFSPDRLESPDRGTDTAGHQALGSAEDGLGAAGVQRRSCHGNRRQEADANRATSWLRIVPICLIGVSIASGDPNVLSVPPLSSC